MIIYSLVVQLAIQVISEWVKLLDICNNRLILCPHKYIASELMTLFSIDNHQKML